MLVKKNLHVKVEESRMDKLRKLAEYKKKTITAVIEDWLDTVDLPQ